MHFGNKLTGQMKTMLLGVWIIVGTLFVAPVSAQTVLVDGTAVITFPNAGDVLSDGSTIFFSPGDLDIYQWRITVGVFPESTGLYDSDVRNFNSEPWEHLITGIPNDGNPVTLRFWQRDQQGRWISSDTVFNTTTGGAAKAPVVVENTETSSPVVAPTTSLKSVTQTEIRNTGATAQALNAVHRDGQTFLTWVEVNGASYHVYRHSQPITDSNIQVAEKLTAKWGPLDADTSLNKHAHGLVPETYVISDLGQPLSPGQGLFVHTTAKSGNAYYAVTTVINGSESLSLTNGENTTGRAIAENVAPAKPVLTLSLNRGKGRVYTQYMDYANWNPTFNGYAYNYSLTLPVGYRKSKSYPLLVVPHAYGGNFEVKEESEYGWQVIQIFPSDPGYNQGAIHSWWYGYAADHNYQADGSIPVSGNIENYTQQRVLKSIEDTIVDPDISVDASLIHAYGHSMGASGSLSFGIHYGEVFAGIYGSEAMTNYQSSPKFQEELEQLWGGQSRNLPIVNRGPYSDSIKPYDGTGVWDWMNHHKQLVKRRGDRMSYLMIAQGKADTVIDWQTQGEPLARVFNEAQAGYSARFEGGAGHSWLGFAAVVHNLFGLGDDSFPWRYPRELSFPSIQYATGSGSLNPDPDNTDIYNMNIEWATKHTPFAKPIVDKRSEYEISLRSTSTEQTEQVASITPRNTQRFKVQTGAQCNWKTVDGNNRRTLDQGQVTADEFGLVTVRDVRIQDFNGTRVFISCT